ncbi:DotU family type IV/VI secretion system protein [Burkholderia guangdongensis]|uniref:DotU family type IV/VI secretion system protein n=1 Tax=Burkholderia guangdongensis TaxID=1792500 RepID=UPI0015C6E846|nr:DotU family type IV/VI secretion system protein [Burkholderia guangdongensis]
MNAVTPNRHEAALLQGATGAGRVSGDGIRDLLSNTALLVTTLAPGGQTRDAGALRKHCRQLIDSFSLALERRGYPEDVRNEALVAQCGLLDETALRYLPTDSRSGWALKPLQVEQFNLHDAGERVFDRLEARMRETPPQVDLLECYSAVLGCGFVGRYARYAREGEAKRAALIRSLDAQLDRLRPSREQPFNADRAERRLSDWFYRLSPWAIAGIGCVAAAIVWGAWAAGLDMQVEHLVPAKVVQP